MGKIGGPKDALLTLRVFTDREGRHGNPLGVVRDPTAAAKEMLTLTRQLGYSETILFDGWAGRVRIFGPAEELPFAGHPIVGAAWLLSEERGPITRVRCDAGECQVSKADGLTWITARAGWAPDWSSIQYERPADVDELVEAPSGYDFVQTWSWIDELAGRIRARVFTPRVGIAEDEACGSASLLLAHRLGRELVINHGRGSVVHARPIEDDLVEIGGYVAVDSVSACDWRSAAFAGRPREIAPEHSRKGGAHAAEGA